MKYAMEQRLRAGRLREQQCNRSAAAVTNNPFRGCSRVSVRHGSLSRPVAAGLAREEGTWRLRRMLDDMTVRMCRTCRSRVSLVWTVARSPSRHGRRIVPLSPRRIGGSGARRIRSSM